MAPLNWLELPNHLHALVMNKLLSIPDYIHFRVVCRSWHSVFDHYIQLAKIPRPQLPLLLIPSDSSSSSTSPPPLKIDDDNNKAEEDETEEKQRSVYSISQRKVYDLGIKLPYNVHCRGSSHGWLVTVEEDVDFSVRLFNPFLSVNNEIQLPSLKTFQHDDDDDEDEVWDYTFLKRTILSKDPISSSNTEGNKDLMVVGIYGKRYRLAFCKPGDESWTCLPYELLTGLADVTYYKGMLYTVGWRGAVVAFDLHAFITSRPDDDQQYYLKPKVVVIRTVAPSPLGIRYGGLARYVLESSGDLLQVQRFYNIHGDYSRKTIKFKVFKLLNEGENYCNWEEVKSLRGHSLFLGDNGSMSLSAAEFSGCMSNCIYFTDDYIEKCFIDQGAEDFGVFNLEDGSIGQHYTIKPETLIWPPPIWVQPTLEL